MSDLNAFEFNIFDVKINHQRDLIRSAIGDKIFYKVTSAGYKFLTRISDNYGLDFIFSNSNGYFYAEPFTSRLVCDIAKFFGGIGVFAGGYIGDIAIPAAKSGMTSIAFEPESSSRELFIMNCILNDVKIDVSDKGLFKAKGHANLFGSDATSTIISRGNFISDSTPIDLIDLDSYLFEKAIDLNSINLIQLDMEGAESSALIGASNLLTNFSPFLIVEIHSLYDDFKNGLHMTETCRILREFGYKILCLRDYNTHYPVPIDTKYEFIPIDKCFLDGPPHGFNLIAFKNDLPLSRDRYIIVENVSPKLIPNKFHNPLFKLQGT
jgi:FkbM family methyltransferase